MSNSCVDKDHLYGEFQRTQRWRDKLSRKLAHKSLDIPDDEMDIRVQKGIGWKDILAAGALGMAGWWLFTHQPVQTPTPAPPAVESVDTDTQYRFEFGTPKPKGGQP